MEQLRSLIPSDVKRRIMESTPENLVDSCSSVIESLRPLPDFQRVIRELTDLEFALCRKSKEAALGSKTKGNECFTEGDFPKALNFYSQALRHAPVDADDAGRNLVATLYINRATSMHKMDLFEETLRDCNRAIMLMPAYAKAWYRRGMANCSLKNYQTAAYDLEVALCMEPSLPGKVQIKNELDAILRNCLSRNKEYSCDTTYQKRFDTSDEPPHIVLECVSTPYKGRGMISVVDIPPSSLIHCEEPLAAIVAKSCRETHCHFCFGEVPADVVYCPSCTIPVYCSQHCQEQAAGSHSREKHRKSVLKQKLTGELEKYFTETLSAIFLGSGAGGSCLHVPEHINECGGVNWSAILPPDVVLAGRVMVHLTKQQTVLESQDFCHNYLENSPNAKIELHVFAIVLLNCLERCCVHFPSVEAFLAQLVLLISQIRVNSMAIVHIKSSDGLCLSTGLSKHFDKDSSSTCSMEQVRVGQALYSNGRFFNHSCEPNVHAYFISRKLFLRTVKYVPASCPIELSYGPQVGQWGILDRQRQLQEQYSFKCQCTGCSKLNFSDIVMNSLRCPKVNCLGAIEEVCNFEVVEDGHLLVSDASSSCALTLPGPGQDITEVACMLQKQGFTRQIGCGYCLTCGSYLDIPFSRELSVNAMRDIQRLKDCAVSTDDPKTLILDCLDALGRVRSVRHQYSRLVAHAEDFVAEVLVRFGELESALQHCQASLEVLEKLYNGKHIVIGNELLKLASIQISIGARDSAVRSIDRLEEIFSIHYGSHVSVLFPFVVSLRKEADLLP